MSGDLMFSVGVDATPLDAGISEIDRRLEAAGVKFAQAPAKFANESAKAFEQIFSSEKKLADYRDAQAFKRLSDEDKLTVLRQQALGFLQSAQAIEGKSAEKADLLLQYEKKKTEIFDINRKIQTESLAEQKKITEEVDSQSKKYTGVNGALETIKKGFKDLGIDIKGAGLGIFFAQLIAMGKEAINNAQLQRDVYERMKQPLDANTASLAKFGDGLDMVRKASVGTVGFIVSGYTLIGESIGSAVNRLRGISEAQEKVAEASDREAKYQEARLKALREEQYNRERIRDAAKEVADAEQKYAFNRLNDEKQWQAMAEKNIQLRVKLNALERTGQSDTVKYQQLRKELVEQNSALLEKDAQLVKETAAKQIETISTVGTLAITYDEKRKVLTDQRKVLENELRQLQEKGLATEETKAKLLANAVQQHQLLRSHNEAIALDNDRILEITKLQYKAKTQGLNEVDQAVLNVYKLQTEERKNQARIDELIIVKRQKELTPAQQKELDTLLEQEKVIERKLKATQANLDIAIKQNAAEQVTSENLGDQVLLLQKQGVSNEQIVGTLTTRGAKEAEVLKYLEEQRQKLEEQHALVVSIRRVGTAYEQQSTDALEGVRARLKAQLDQVKQQNASLPRSQRNPFEFSLQSELDQVNRELSLRKTIGTFASQNGEDAARYKYGDSATDRALRDQQDSLTKTQKGIANIEELLRRSPFFKPS